MAQEWFNRTSIVTFTAIVLIFQFVVLLKLHENIHVILMNYVEAMIGKKGQWVQVAKVASFVMIGIMTFFLAITMVSDNNLAISIIAFTACMLWGIGSGFLIYENWNMYWVITLRRMKFKWFSLLAGIGLLLSVICIVQYTQAENGGLLDIVLLSILALISAMTLYMMALVRIVRIKNWRIDPPKSPNWFSTTIEGIYDFSNRQSIPYTEASKVVTLDQKFGGEWILLGDLDQDDALEVVSVRNRLHHDSHDVASIAVQKMDGSLLWQWGEQGVGKETRSYDLACQIYDLDFEGVQDVVLANLGWVIVLDGKNGIERRRFKIETRFCDMIMFIDVSGVGRATDILIKDRYHKLWVYDKHGKLIYTVVDPGGYMLAHKPLAFDIDGDGKDELLVGFAMIDHDGSLLWTHNSERVALWFGGHMDSACVVSIDTVNRENTRILITYCDATGIAMLDGNGKVIWEYTGRHYATVTIAYLMSEKEDPQIVVDLGHLARDSEGEIWILNLDGVHLATLYGSHRAFPVNWLHSGVQQLACIPKDLGDGFSGEIPKFAMAKDFYRFRTCALHQADILDLMKVDGGNLFLYYNPMCLGYHDKSMATGTGINVTSYQVSTHDVR